MRTGRAVIPISAVRMVIVMQTRGPDGFDGPFNAAVNRRQLLALAGTAGLATVLSACS